MSNTGLTQASIANTSYEIDFKIKDVESMVVSADGSPPTINSYADIADSGKFNSSGSGNTLIRNTDLNSLVYPLPQSPIKTTTAGGNTVSYTFKAVQKALPSDSSGKLTITLTNPAFRFMPSGGTLSETNAKENFIVIVKTNATTAQTYVNAVASGSTFADNSAISRQLVVGEYLDLGALNDAGTKIRPVTISTANPTRTTVDIYCNTNAIFVADVIYTVESTATNILPGPIVKQLVAGNGSHFTSNGAGSPYVPVTDLATAQFYLTTPNQEQNQIDTIPVSDAFNLVKVVDSGRSFIEVSNAMMTSTANDITHMYTFDSGIKDKFYDH